LRYDVFVSRLLVACFVVLAGCTTFGASSDTSDGGATPGNTSCAGQHTVCQNFDQGPPSPPWSVSNLGTAATIVSSPVVSPPSSLKAVLDASQGPTFPLVSVTLPSPTKHVRCSAQIQIAEVSNTGGAALLRMNDPSGKAFVELDVQATLLKLDTSSGGGHELPPAQVGSFAALSVEVSTVAPGFMTYSGPGKETQLPLPAPLVDLTFAEVDFGLPPNGTLPKITAYFDDLSCDVLP
jgi:hypothetical protein